MLEAELVDADPSVYTLTVPGVTPAGGQPGVEYAAPTRMQLLNIPLLRDVDDNAGLYAALQGLSTSWTGAAVYDGENANALALVGGVSQASVIGSAQTALGAWTLNMIDDLNTVDVQLTSSSTLTSTTRDNILDTDANACLLGDEILQFRTATALGTGLYRLSGLRRGRRGTEWAAGEHAVGERFVLLQTAGLLRLAMDLADVDRVRSYQAVTVGQSQSDSEVQSFTNTAAGLKPLAPAMFDVGQDGNQFSLRWVRRSRLRDDWLNGNVPLGESSESYELEVVPVSGGLLTYEASSSPLIIDAVTYLAQGYRGRGARRAVKSGSYIYGFGYSGELSKQAASNLGMVANTIDANVFLVGCTGLAASGSNIFTTEYGNPPFLPGKLRKFETTALALVQSVDFPLPGDGFGMNTLTVCAGSLWVGLEQSQKLRRYDPTTMLPVADIAIRVSALGTDGTYVYGLGLSGTSIYKVDPATNTVVATYALGAASDNLAIAGGYAFYIQGGRLVIIRTSDGSQVANPFNSDVTGSFTTAGNYISVANGLNVTVINASTLSLYGTFMIPTNRADFVGAGQYVQLITQDQIIASDYRGTFGADLYDRTQLGAGTVFNLYQMSADVGRGFAATRTL
jgi:hypothetical protein